MVEGFEERVVAAGIHSVESLDMAVWRSDAVLFFDSWDHQGPRWRCGGVVDYALHQQIRVTALVPVVFDVFHLVLKTAIAYLCLRPATETDGAG